MAILARLRDAQLFGPTTGDLIYLAYTDLLIEITDDLSGGPGRAGDEAVFGGGKVIRESMGQSRATRADGAPDTVITGVVVLDHWGIVKADLGIRDGRIVALGKAGNPDTMDGVHPDLVIGPTTEIIAGNGKIVTAGAIHGHHVHFICPQILDEALGNGITTLIGGGTGPAEGSKATTVTPGAWHFSRVDPRRDRSPADEHRAARQGQHRQRRGDARADPRRRIRIQTPRGLGEHPGGDRRVPAGRRRDRRPGGPALRHAQRGGLRRVDPRRHRRRSIHAYHTEGQAAGTRPTSSPWPRTRMCFPRRPIRRVRTPSTPSTSTSTCSWCATTST